ncbi:hypothetical protein K438DRAFT_1268728 [Mycena galopus ATCC 62051]|nr:hypothetical protein K438DRAFT_1268728 [Mycena galopus ATCC 62051]
MKRGFLNSAKAKATRPLEPVTSLASNLPARASQTLELTMPIGKVEKVVLPDGYKSEFITDMLYTTLPQAAGQTAGEPTTECLFFPGSKEVFTNLSGYPKPLKQPATAAFRTGVVPGKGMGLFSTRALKMGDLILTERPLLLAPVGTVLPYPPGFTPAQYLQLCLNEKEKALEKSVDRMNQESKAAFMALANCHTEDGSGPLMGIIRTNGLGVSGLRPGVKGRTSNYSATCKHISRLNHSCSPNTQPRFDKVSVSYRLWAVRDIAAGEELTYQYVDAEFPAAKRNEDLKPYAVVCDCSSCNDPAASDARRAAIGAFTPTTIMWALNTELSNDWLIDKCREQLLLLETEGLQHLPAYFDATKSIMEAYICLGDARSASQWAAKLHKQKWAPDYAEGAVSRLLLDPANTTAYKDHQMWRMRVGDARPGSMGKVFQDLAALAPNGMKALPGGGGMMLFPMFPFPGMQ